MTDSLKPKAKNGEGRIYLHPNGSWAYQITLGTVAGKRVRKAKTGFTSESRARKAMREAQHDARTMGFVEPSRRTLNDWLDTWAQSLSIERKASTVTSYQYLMDRHVRPRLGDLPIQSITTEQIDAMYAALLTEGTPSEPYSNGKARPSKPLSPRTVRYLHTTLRLALNDAVDRKWISANPTNGAKAPSAKKAQEAQRDFDVWSPDQVRTFLEFVEGDYMEPLFRLAFLTGKRRSELLGLRWRDVELDSSKPTIRTVVGRTSHATTSPKTDAAARTIALDARTAEVLRRHRADIRERRMQLGLGRMSRDQAVFASPDGQEVHVQTPTKRFQKLAKRAGLPVIRFHDIRHTWATTALREGVNVKVVSERIGHSDVQTTLRVYAHFLPADDRDAAETVAAVFS